MTPDLQTQNSVGITPLISGIISDLQVLLRQQLSLFQSEVKKEIGQTKHAAIPLAIGAVVCFLAGIFLFLMVAHLLVWIWPQLALFAAYGIVGIFLALIGGGLVISGKSKFDAFSPIPEKSVEGLKENIQWTTKM